MFKTLLKTASNLTNKKKKENKKRAKKKKKQQKIAQLRFFEHDQRHQPFF